MKVTASSGSARAIIRPTLSSSIRARMSGNNSGGSSLSALAARRDENRISKSCRTSAGSRPLNSKRDVSRMALADKSQDTVRRGGAEHLAYGVMIDGRGLHAYLGTIKLVSS